MRSLITVITVLFTISFCSASCSKENAPSQNNDQTNLSTTKMKITIGTDVFTVSLYDNPSVNVFKAMLPLTIEMKELNNNEKYYDLPSNLPTNASVGESIHLGDLMLYGSSTLVLFYKDFNTSYSYTKLGSVDNPIGLAAALGNGNIVVAFENY